MDARAKTIMVVTVYTVLLLTPLVFNSAWAQDQSCPPEFPQECADVGWAEATGDPAEGRPHLRQERVHLPIVGVAVATDGLDDLTLGRLGDVV